ncbi:hypothetical protein OHB36_23615 [Streptomyces sp. NBC_00320]|uniref:hypothetical protein n=1 Tax=Streptomyces sp. NBC_00320 TaxID=2975711 RepID=UPI002254027C|nr:hypothetical protein [Streptomyces sp. NBC_00320]MCX5149731.1 hypothetical protein [Streptomyces sp. NBC_00320]
MKLAAHAVRPLWRNQIHSPFGRVLPTAPLHEMFAAAWERVRGGAEGGAEGGGGS